MTADTGAVAALAGLELMFPRRLRLLLDHHRPDDAFERLVGGRVLDPMFARSMPAQTLAGLRDQARRTSARAAAEQCERLGVKVIIRSHPDYPGQLAVDPDPPPALFARGDFAVLDGRRVGVIGTRNATAAGRATASELAGVLARHGVVVVSGLARGIDGAAHQGVRDAGGPGRPVAVVGNGLDRPYPRQHVDLWNWVGSDGLLLSEWPPGVAPHAWHFPLRNRVLAALCEVLVVVESRERGGSLITADLAAERGVDVMAVPGSPRSRASAGTNQLLVEGAAPVVSASDVLDVLSIEHRRQAELPFDPRPRPDAVQRHVMAICARGPSTIDVLVDELGIDITEVAMSVARLERAGWIVESGGWFELAGSRLGAR